VGTHYTTNALLSLQLSSFFVNTVSVLSLVPLRILSSDEVRPSMGDREHRNSRGRLIVTKADKKASVSEILPAGYKHDLGLKDIGSSRRRFTYDSRSLAGKKDGKDKVNQDSFLTRDPWRIPGLDAGNDFQLFALMDGHGDQGEKVSNYIKVNLPLVLAEEPGLKENNIVKALLNGIEKMCKDLAADKTVDSKMSGSTLVCCIVHGTKLYVANIGDSRCIMGRRRNAGSTSGLRVIALSTDQHPDRPDEMQRIVASKQGMVSRMMSDDGHYVGPLRVWAKDGTGAGLAMSRSIGDEDAHKNGVISIPEVLERSFDELDQFLIFASDGVWDYISCEEAVEMVEKERARGKTPKDCATTLTDEARSRWGTSDHVDDISAIIVFLQ
jgi:serine/threonine protein phosphatase PrpC